MTKRSHPSKMLRQIFGILGVLAALVLMIACGERATETPTDLTAPTIGVDSPSGSSTPSGHEGSGGLVLGPDSDRETVYTGALCGPNAPVRDYSLVAINVEISLNRYLDYDHMGRMYVLEDRLEQVREEEAQNRAARLDQAEPAVSIGLQGDAIQPLTLRVNQGECLRLTLRNGMDNGEPASLHLHGSSLFMTIFFEHLLYSNHD